MSLNIRSSRFFGLSIACLLTIYFSNSRPLYSLEDGDRSNPGNEPGQGRGECRKLSNDLPNFTSLVASSATNYELTSTSSHPTLWVYSPYSVQQGTKVEFVVYNRSGNDPSTPIHESLVSAMEPGIIGIPLPETAPPLIEGNNYEWMLRVHCDSGTVRAEGQITFTSNVDGNDLAWYDQVTEVATQLRENPTNQSLLNQWRNLLTQAGLAEIAEQVPSDCCQSTTIPQNTRP